MEAEIGVINLQVEEHPGLWTATKSLGTGMEQILSRTLRKKLALPTPGFQLPSLQDCEGVHLYCFKCTPSQFVVLGDGGNRKPGCQLTFLLCILFLALYLY